MDTAEQPQTPTPDTITATDLQKTYTVVSHRPRMEDLEHLEGTLDDDIAMTFISEWNKWYTKIGQQEHYPSREVQLSVMLVLFRDVLRQQAIPPEKFSGAAREWIREQQHRTYSDIWDIYSLAPDPPADVL